ncbi:MAG TPA: DUF1080 domain-containing protein [Puia sp.]|nr:DUF1080 domain-containing protein [Puia sp.]
MIKRFACLFITAALLSNGLIAQQTSRNTLSAQEKKDGWELLFDGSSTKGWHPYGKPSATSTVKVEDGTLHLDPAQKPGDIITNDEFSNFDLKVEWKISKNGNSGIIFSVHESPEFKESWNTGPEVQVLDNDGHPDGKIKKHRAGDLYDLISSSSEPVKAVGEWNQAEIRLDKGKLDVYMNGVNVVSTTMWDDHWWNLVKGSKFSAMPGFSKFKTGHIALQDHGNDVWYRNIKIRKL